MVMKYIIPFFCFFFAFILLQNSCSNKPTEIKEVDAKESNFYLDKYLIENKKRLQAEQTSNAISLEYQKKLNYWQNRKQIIKASEPIEDIIDCNDTIIKIRNIAHVNDSLCIELINTHEKKIAAQDSVILFAKNEIFNLNQSLQAKTLETEIYKNNFDATNKLLKSEKKSKWFWKVSTFATLGVLSYKLL